MGYARAADHQVGGWTVRIFNQPSNPGVIVLPPEPQENVSDSRRPIKPHSRLQDTSCFQVDLSNTAQAVALYPFTVGSDPGLVAWRRGDLISVAVC
jgi:hypothetical protein